MDGSQELNLSCSGITDEGVQQLGRCSLLELRVLDLSHNKLGHQALVPIIGGEGSGTQLWGVVALVLPEALDSSSAGSESHPAAGLA